MIGGRYWSRWTEVLAEAGCAPNQFRQRYDDDAVLARLVVEIRRLGRMPTEAERRLARLQDESFPSASVFKRLGRRDALMRKVVAYCEGRPDCQDVVDLLAPLLDETSVREDEDAEMDDDAGAGGFVYLLKSGRNYKIGRTRDVGRRQYDLKIQLPEPATEVHVVKCLDDSVGIERYWHHRFKDRRKNGEWFELSKADVAAFKKRKFM